MFVMALALALAHAPAPSAHAPAPQIQAPAARDNRPQTDQTVPVQHGMQLSVSNFAGEVVVHAWDRDSVHVTARHQARTEVHIAPAANVLAITASATRGPQGSVDYDITVPAWMPVRVEGTYNFIAIDGARGEVFANTVRGDVSIKGGTGFITAKSVEGEVDVSGAHGKLVVSSINQKIKIDGATGEIAAETVNGTITMTGIESNSVDATTVNGTVIFEGRLADGGHYAFETHNGDVLLGLPDAPNATFSVRTYQGSFSSELPLQGPGREEMRRGKRVTLTSGNGSADVSLETFGGSIRIRKGATGRVRTGQHPGQAGEL